MPPIRKCRRAGRERDPGPELEAPVGKTEEGTIGLDHQRAEPGSEAGSRDNAEQDHDGGELEVVQEDRLVGIAERLQSRDLLALDLHQPSHDDMQEKTGDAEEDQRHDDRHGALLGQLILDEAMRGMVAPGDRATAAIGLEQPVHLRHHGRRVGLRREPDDEIVEGPAHVEGGLHR